MMTFASLLWKWVGTYEKVRGTTGILERLYGIIGSDLDSNAVVALQAFPKAVAVGSEATDDIVLQHLADIGLVGVSTKLQGTRRLLTYWPLIVPCKGSIRLLKYAYSYYGVTVEDVVYTDFGLRMDYGTLFDIGQPLDTKGANTQRQCVIYLTGPDADVELKNTLVTLAVWNTSPYIILEEVYYNDQPIYNGIISARIAGLTAAPSAGFAEGELQIEYDETKVRFAIIDGELYITVPDGSGLNISNFRIDSNGNLIYG